MTYPTAAINTANMDAASDSAASARADLLDAVTKLNQIIAHTTAFAATLLDDANAAAARTTLGALAAGDNIGSATATTLAEKTATTGVATMAAVDRLRSLSTSTTTGTLVIWDRGARVALTAAVTVPSAVFAANDVVTMYNNSASAIAITQGSGLTMYNAVSGATGSRTLGARGIATVVFHSGTECAISGAGLS